ncbi:MAG TPA: hypothetical protein VMI75_13220 [Polyangiaceae bacterium]|nr:hypothetical protein [Polyangiaceae bacterium]
MEPKDITVEILKDIRDEVRLTRSDLSARIDGTNSRLDETNVRLDRMDQRLTATEIHIATELVAVAGALREVRDDLRQDRALRAQVDDHERRIAAMERRTTG